MKKHLLEGVKKGAFDLEEADRRFDAWVQAKENAVQAKKEALATGFSDEMKKRLKAEVKVNEARLAEIAKKNAAVAAAAAAAAKPAEVAAPEAESPEAEIAEPTTEA